MKFTIPTLLLACALPANAFAQDAVVAQPVAAMTTDQVALPSNTEVAVTLNQEVSSKKIKQGAKFPVSVARDVMIGNYIVIPRGTPGVGEVTYRTGKGAFGKSAKMEVEIRSLTLNGRVIPLSGKVRQEGAGNTGATVGAVVAVGVFAAFVTGKSAVFEQGREIKAFTVEPLPVVLRAGPAPVAAPVATPAAPVLTPVSQTK